MSTYTTASYFASELVLLVMVAFNAHIRLQVPVAVLAVHTAFHILYTGLTLVTPRWARQQNLDRVEAKGTSLAARGWQSLLNTLNFADFALHMLYVTVLALNSKAAEVAICLLAGGWLTYHLSDIKSRQMQPGQLCKTKP